MKKIIFILFMLFSTLALTTSCISTAFAYEDGDVDIDVVVRYGSPYYVNGTIAYYSYNGWYYYPYYVNNTVYYYRYSRPYMYFNPAHMSHYRFDNMDYRRHHSYDNRRNYFDRHRNNINPRRNDNFRQGGNIYRNNNHNIRNRR